jgi:putative two-component system response regulator
MIPFIDQLIKPVILCVDDETIILMSLEQEIRAALGLDVDIELFTSGVDALSFIEEHQAEKGDVVMVISDQVMPHMTGDVLLEGVHRLSPQTKTVMLTGYSNIEALKNAVNSGGLGRYVTKPWDAELMSSILLESVSSYTLARISERHNRQIERISDSLIKALENAHSVFDYDLSKHVQSVSRMCGLLARGAGYPESFIRRIETFSKLHDVGKIGTACALMNKAGRYTPEEYELMKMHVVFGGRVFDDVELDPMARNIALYHHEKWDGSGYQSGLSGEAIPPEARIVAVVDVFDALISKRPYKAAMKFDDATRIVGEGRGAHFDPNLVDIFFSRIEEVKALCSLLFPPAV